MKPYPLIMNLLDRQVVVIGGGKVAYRKVLNLLESGAVVTIIAPKIVDELRDLVSKYSLTCLEQPFMSELLDQIPEITLIFGTTDKRDVNLQIYNAAKARKIPCNIADVPDLCTFIVPAVISQGELLIAVSTGGASPALASKIRADLSNYFGPEYAEMTKLMGELRKLVLQLGKTSDENKILFKAIVESELLIALRNRDKDLALQILKTILHSQIDDEQIAELLSGQF